jgi:hypothetical protein
LKPVIRNVNFKHSVNFISDIALTRLNKPSRLFVDSHPSKGVRFRFSKKVGGIVIPSSTPPFLNLKRCLAAFDKISRAAFITDSCFELLNEQYLNYTLYSFLPSSRIFDDFNLELPVCTEI